MVFRRNLLHNERKREKRRFLNKAGNFDRFAGLLLNFREYPALLRA